MSLKNGRSMVNNEGGVEPARAYGRTRMTGDKDSGFRFYTVEQISPNKELTPEGFLLCRGVPVARTGEQKYLPDEIGLEGLNGLVTVNRTEDQVFRPETLASFEGKDISLQHPYDMDGVTPKNYQSITRGVMLNVRKSDTEPDLLLADLLIKDQQAIDKVLSKELTEVSCGYDCDYIQDSPGYAHQENIVGNHVALVTSGRAGKRCSIQDHNGGSMATKENWFSKLIKAAKTHDEESVQSAIKEAYDEENEEAEKLSKSEKKVTDALNKIVQSLDELNERVKKIEEDEATVEGKEEKTEDDDMDDMTADTIIEAEKAGKFDNGTSYTGDSDTLSRIELLIPGFKVKTGDAATSYGKLIKLKTKALDAALQTEHGSACVTPFMKKGKSLDAMTSGEVNTLFISASELARNVNNATAKGGKSFVTHDHGSKKATSIAEINAANAAFYQKQGAK